MAISMKRAALFQGPSARLNLGIIAAGAALIVGATIARLHPPADIFLLLCMGIVISAPLLLRVAQGRFDIFEPTVAFFLVWGVMFLLRPTVSLLEGDFVYSRPSREIAYDSTFVEMLAIALLGASAFVCGYFLSGGNPSSRMRWAPSPSVGAAVFVGSSLALIGIVSFAAFVIGAGGPAIILDGRSHALTAAIQDSSVYIFHAPFVLIPAGLTFLILWKASGNRAFLLVGLLLLAIVLLRALPVGSRSHLLPLATGLVVALYGRRRLRPNLFKLTGFVVFALTVSSLLLVNRSSDLREDTGVWNSFTAVVNEPALLLDPILHGEDAAMSETLAVALLVTPEKTGHSFGKATFGDLISRPIPREWWTSKPEPPRRQLIQEIWPAEFAGEGVGGIANPEFSALLFWYLDFSWPGVLIAMALYGFVLRRLYEYFRQGSDSPWIRVFYGVAIGLLAMGLRDSPVDTLIRFMFIGAPLWFVLTTGGRATKSGEDTISRRGSST